MQKAIVVLGVMAISFGVSAKILSGPDLENQAMKACAKRDVLDLNVPFNNKAPTEPLFGIDSGMIQATIDALKANPGIPATDSVACEKAAVTQYGLGKDKYRKL